MSHPASRANLLRRSLLLGGEVNVEVLADCLGLKVLPWPFPPNIFEVKWNRVVGVSSRLSPVLRRWAIAHAIGHDLMHPGNHLWLRAHTHLADPFEREEEMYEFVWPASTDQMRRFWADPELATQWGAEAVAILLVLELTDLIVIERSCKGTGIDYWLGQATSDALLFQNKARLEVSGIRNGSDSSVNQRVKQKIEQTRRSDGALPAYVIVVEFSRPRCRVIKRGVP